MADSNRRQDGGHVGESQEYTDLMIFLACVIVTKCLAGANNRQNTKQLNMVNEVIGVI